MEKQKICIIGGGLTGLITAIALSKLNLKVDLITDNIKKNLKSNRSVAISQENYNFLKKLNIFKFYSKIFWPCSKIQLYTNSKKERHEKIFQFNKEKNPKKNILYIAENSKIIQNMIKYIKKNKLISFKIKKEISEIVSSGLLKGLGNSKKFGSKYNLIIICTGGNSKLVKNIFNEKPFKYSYKEISITAKLFHDPIKNNIARQIFMDKEILALLPISNKKTSIVWSVEKKIMEKYESKGNLFLKNKIKFYTENFLKNAKFSNNIEKKELFFLIRKKYYQDRILLFGDALHIVHPLAGQGFNMTLRDLMSLEKTLKNKIDLGLDIGSSDILSEFSNQTKPRNFVYSLGIDFIKKSFSFKNFRNKFITKLDKNNFTKDLFYDLADKGLRF